MTDELRQFFESEFLRDGLKDVIYQVQVLGQIFVTGKEPFLPVIEKDVSNNVIE